MTAARTIDRSVKAFEAELRRQVAIHGTLAGDPDELGRRAARAVVAGAAWAADVGPFYDTAGAQAALDGVSKQAVSARATAGRLLALRLAPDGGFALTYLDWLGARRCHADFAVTDGRSQLRALSLFPRQQTAEQPPPLED